MAVINPCCCSLRLGTQIVAIFNIVCSAIALVFCLLFLLNADTLIFVAKSDGDGRNNQKQLLMSPLIVALVIAIIMLIVLLIYIAIGISLFIGAQKRDASKCRVWFNFTYVFLVAAIILYFHAIIRTTSYANSLIRTAGGMAHFGFPIVVLFESYQLWVVSAFIDEIKRGGGRQNADPSGVVYTQDPKSEFPTTPPPPYSAAPGRVYNPTTTTYQNEPATVKYPVLPTENA